MFVVPIRSKFVFKTRFVHVKRIQAILCPSPKIQDGSQKEGMKSKFEIQFTK